MKDVIQPINILKSHKSETYSVNDGRVKVTGKPSKYFSLTLLLSCLCEDHHGKVKYVRNTEVDSSGKPF